MKLFIAPRASSCPGPVGRMIAQGGSVGLQRFRLICSQVVKRHARIVNWVKVGQGSGIARLVLPGLKVHDLGSADAEENSENFQASYLLSQRRVEARATLLNKAKVKSGRESDRLDMVAWVVRVAQFVIVSGNGRMLPCFQARDCVRERRTKIRVGGAAITGPPAGIHRELLKVRKPSSLRDERDLAGRQPGELLQVNLLLAFGF